MAEALRQNFKSLRSRLVACTVEDFQVGGKCNTTSLLHHYIYIGGCMQSAMARTTSMGGASGQD